MKVNRVQITFAAEYPHNKTIQLATTTLLKVYWPLLGIRERSPSINQLMATVVSTFVLILLDQSKGADLTLKKALVKSVFSNTSKF